MSIRSLMSAAHAAGFSMAVTEDSPADAPAAQSPSFIPLPAPRREPAGAFGRALVVRVAEADRSVWMREWFHGFRGRAPA